MNCATYVLGVNTYMLPIHPYIHVYNWVYPFSSLVQCTLGNVPSYQMKIYVSQYRHKYTLYHFEHYCGATTYSIIMVYIMKTANLEQRY